MIKNIKNIDSSKKTFTELEKQLKEKNKNSSINISKILFRVRILHRTPQK